MRLIWKASTSRHTTLQHLFYTNRSTTSICGTIIRLSSDSDWTTDENVLKRRKKCSRCLRTIQQNPIYVEIKAIQKESPK